jgi:hypothetical protein
VAINGPRPRVVHVEVHGLCHRQMVSLAPSRNGDLSHRPCLRQCAQCLVGLVKIYEPDFSFVK